MTALAALHCQPLEGKPPMASAEVTEHLARCAGWSLVNGAIEKQFRFADHYRTLAFVNAVAWIAHREDHHPEVAFGYDRCSVRFSTHSVGGISINDFICAAKVQALLD